MNFGKDLTDADGYKINCCLSGMLEEGSRSAHEQDV